MQHLGSDLMKVQQHDHDERSDDEAPQPQARNHGKTKPNKTKPTASAPAPSAQQPADTRPRRNAATRAAVMAFTCMQEALGITLHATKLAHASRAETVLRMRHDGPGCMYAAFFATQYI